MAFKIAGSMAAKAAAQKASPVLLEPMMTVVVETPSDYTGTVSGDMSRRRGQIQGIEPRTGVETVTALVPLSEMFGYATALRSATQGRAAFTMQFERYEPVPQSIAETIKGK
jgi:elongation factor G